MEKLSTGKDSDEMRETTAVGISLVLCLPCLCSEQLKLTQLLEIKWLCLLEENFVPFVHVFSFLYFMWHYFVYSDDNIKCCCMQVWHFLLNILWINLSYKNCELLKARDLFYAHLLEVPDI